MILELEAFGEQLISRKILRVADRAVDARPAWREIRRAFVEAEADLFATEGASSGRAWQELSPVTVEIKEREGSDSRILHGRGDLEASLATLGGPDQIFEAALEWMVFGTAVPWARWHQRGTTILAVRRPLDFSEAVKRFGTKILQRYIMTGEV